jgi:hypothetical protein
MSANVSHILDPPKPTQENCPILQEISDNSATPGKRPCTDREGVNSVLPVDMESVSLVLSCFNQGEFLASFLTKGAQICPNLINQHYVNLARSCRVCKLGKLKLEPVQNRPLMVDMR